MGIIANPRQFVAKGWTGVHRDFYAQAHEMSASSRFHIYDSIYVPTNPICATRQHRIDFT